MKSCNVTFQAVMEQRRKMNAQTRKRAVTGLSCFILGMATWYLVLLVDSVILALRIGRDGPRPESFLESNWVTQSVYIGSFFVASMVIGSRKWANSTHWSSGGACLIFLLPVSLLGLLLGPIDGDLIIVPLPAVGAFIGGYIAERSKANSSASHEILR